MCYVGLDIGGTNVRYTFTNDLDLKVTSCQKRPFENTRDLYIIEDDANCGAIGEYYHLSDSVNNLAYYNYWNWYRLWLNFKQFSFYRRKWFCRRTRSHLYR